MTKAPDRTVPVTVLLPVHNGGRHLAAAVESILTQSHRDLELLAIDDGSTDGSGEWLDALSDPRVRVLHQPNRGLVATLNRGLAEARYDLVARMDADDISEPHRLELQLRHLRDHPDVAAVGCCYRVVDEADRLVREVHAAGTAAYLHRRLYFRNVLPHAGMTFRRDVVRAAGGYREVGPVEDYDLWVRLSERHTLACLPEPLLRYRASPTGISIGDNERQRRCLRETRDQLHATRPLAPISARKILREGLQHVATYGQSCPDAARRYAFDHVWIAILLARRRRLRAAARVLAGALGFVVARPAAARGLLDVVLRR